MTYKDVSKILKNLGFKQELGRSSSHQNWIIKRKGKYYSVTVSFHGYNKEYKRGTLSSIIRQSGFTKSEFYYSLKKKRKK